MLIYMRIIIPIVFLFLAFIQKKCKKINLYHLALFLYICFLSFRYMQGTDYATYMVCYESERNIFDAFTFGFVNGQFELLYNIIVSLCKTLCLPFYVFISIVNIANVCLLKRFMDNFSENKILSLFFVYLLYGIVFLESAIRQSLSIGIIIGVCLVAFKKNNMNTLFLGSLGAFLFHRSSIIISFFLISLFLIYNIFDSNKIIEYLSNKKNIIIMIAILLFIMIQLFPFESLVLFLPPVLSEKMSFYLNNYSFSFFAIILRLFYLIMFLILIKANKISLLDRNNVLYLVYFVGLVIYFYVMRFSILSRLTVYFETLEVCVFVNLLNHKKRLEFLKLFFLSLYCACAIVLFIHDGIATQEQLNYPKINIFYPYYTYFNYPFNQ